MTLLLFVFFPVVAQANNISIANAGLGLQNTTNHTVVVQFDINWLNAWRDSDSAIAAATGNYDAAWVFIKYSTDGGVTWNHATLKATGGTTISDGGTGGILNPSGFSGGTSTVGGTSYNLDIVAPTEATSGKKGAFVQISSGQVGTVSGTLNSTGVQFLWDTGTDIGTSSANDITAASAIIDVMAIEMVYVPTSSFYIGDGSASPEGNFQLVSSANTPVQITSSTSAAVNGSSTSNSYDDAQMKAPGAGITITGPSGIACGGGASCVGSSATSNTSFPTGYNAFYMMKYDVSQGQYRDFLNTLTRTQQNTRTASQTASQYVMSNTALVNYRDGIRAPSSIPSGPITFGCDLQGITANNTTAGNGVFNESVDGEWLAANDLSYMDGAAYAAWAGLRPFTELEYEKAARGPSSADTGTADEYAWGSITITQATSVSNSGQNSEVAGQTGNGLCLYGNSFQGPMRCGFAATSSTTRAGAGASYWGIMDLSGQLWKRPVTVGNATGRAFLGSNGTGVLATDGNATNCDWPGSTTTCPTVGEVSGATGCGFRGGGWSVASTLARVSDRYYAAYVNTTRIYERGARFARTSP